MLLFLHFKSFKNVIFPVFIYIKKYFFYVINIIAIQNIFEKLYFQWSFQNVQYFIIKHNIFQNALFPFKLIININVFNGKK